MNGDEMMLNTILQNGELPDDFQPQSRFEAIAKSIINKEDYTEKPQSRHEELFLEIGKMIKEGGGGYPEPTGKIIITENGTDVNVKDYATADVEVIPTGELSITENGTYNVINYASANVNVQSHARNELIWTSMDGEEYGELPYTPDELVAKFDVISFAGARGASTNIVLGQYSSSRIKSTSTSAISNDISLVAMSKRNGVRILNELMVEFGSTNASITFNVLSHFSIVNPSSPDISVTYEPTDAVKLYSIIGTKY